MQRITPTGWAKQKGVPVKQLGSTEAVLAMLPDGAVIVHGGGQSTRIQEALQAAGRSRGALTLVGASACPHALLEIPAETVIGVDVDAFVGVMTAMWEDTHRLLTTRFREVHWG